MARRRLLRVALLVAASMAVSTVAYASAPADAVSAHAIRVGALTRSWTEIAPAPPMTDSVPIIVILSGRGATTPLEISRDGLVSLVRAGQAELIYPAGVGESWNAGGCCGRAASENVDDVAFMRALVNRIDPGHDRPVYLVGYSNGGRLAYRIACTDPALFDATAVVKAMPEPGCVVPGPVTILQIDSTNDYAVPYQPGDAGQEQPAATAEVGRVRAADGCAAPGTDLARGSLLLQTWSHCRGAATVAFATYHGGRHSWPAGNAATPSAASVIWGFFSASSSFHRSLSGRP